MQESSVPSVPSVVKNKPRRTQRAQRGDAMQESSVPSVVKINHGAHRVHREMGGGRTRCDRSGEICNPKSGKDKVTNGRNALTVPGTYGDRVCWGV